MRTQMVPLVCAFFSTTLLAWNYSRFGYQTIAFSSLIVFILWAGLVSRVRWVSSLLLFVIFVLSGAGLYFGLPAVWLLLAWVVAILAWDLINFSFHMKEAPRVENSQQFENRHLIWLLSTLSLGLLFAVLALYIQLTLNFWIALVLSALLVWGIGRGIKMFKDSGS